MPSNRTLPALGSRRRSASRPSVDLPQPLSPIRPRHSPGAIVEIDTHRRRGLRARHGATKRASSDGTRGEVAGDAADVAAAAATAMTPVTATPGGDSDVTPSPRGSSGPRHRAVRSAWRSRRGRCAAGSGRRSGSRPASRIGIRDAAGNRGATRASGRSSGGRRAEQPRGVGMRGARDDPRGRAGLDHLAGIHHRDAVAMFRHHAEIVRDQHQAHAQLGAQRAQQLQHLRLHRDVQRRGRLVGDQQPRARRRARSRSSRAGACRRRVRADRRRRRRAGSGMPTRRSSCAARGRRRLRSWRCGGQRLL